MGFDSFKKKFKQFTGAEFFPVGDFLEDPTGSKAAAKKQAAALRAAGMIEEALKLEAEIFRAQILEETAPFREQGRAELERLKAQQPGETEFFKRSLEKGTTAIAQQAAGFGLADSGATQVAFGELGGQLLSQEELQRQQGLQGAAALSQLGFGTGLGALQVEGSAASRLAQTEANIGAVKAQGDLAKRQFFIDIGSQLLGLGGGALLGAPAGGAALGQPAPTQGGFNLQQPQFNQFQPQQLGFNSFQQPQFGLGR